MDRFDDFDRPDEGATRPILDGGRHRWQRSLLPLVAAVSLSAGATGCDIPPMDGTDGSNPSPNGTFTSPLCTSSAQPLARAVYDRWQTIVLDDVIPGDAKYTCGDGTPYKFFVLYQPTSTDLVVSFEPGGACWDYQTCTGEAGKLSTVRLSSPPDNLMTNLSDPKSNPPWAALYPHLGRIDNGVATNKYNQVFFPYCTGDVYAGDTERTYTAEGRPSKTVQHRGRSNIRAAAQWLAQAFPATHVGQLLVIGASAGAVGGTLNYPTIRDTIAPRCSALVSDSGPIFPPGGPQTEKVLQVSTIWNLTAPGAIADQLDQRLNPSAPFEQKVKTDFGNINRSLASTYANDRFLFSAFYQDLNFSLFSFAGTSGVPLGANLADRILVPWIAELNRFGSWTDARPNWGYYLPIFRPDNCSHTVTMSPVMDANLHGFVMMGLDGRADGYRRTDRNDLASFQDLQWNAQRLPVSTTVVRSTHFGDVLRQLLDPTRPIPRLKGVPKADQLTFTSAQGVGVAEATWHDYQGVRVTDKQAFINRAKEECTNVNMYAPPAATTTLTDAPIGIAGGSRTETGMIETITAAGADIWGTTDQFFFAYKPVSGDGTAVVKVTGLTNTDAFAKAGLMFRAGTGANAANTMIEITPGAGAIFQKRLTTGGTTTNSILAGRAAPTWLRLVRTGNTFTGSVSTDLVTWTQVGDPVTFASFATSALVGLAVTSHNSTTPTTATFDYFSWMPAEASTLTDANIGASGGARAVSLGATHTITAAGADIWGGSDQFFYSFKNLSGDGMITARVTGLANTNAFAKAGLMFRNGGDANAANAMIAITPSSGALFQHRLTPGANSNNAILTGRGVPTWLRLVRAGNTFTGFVSTDGLGWIQVGAPTTIAGFQPSALVGMAVTSHNAGTATTATFTDVTMP